MAFLQQEVGKGVCVCALASTSVDISMRVSMQLWDQTCVVTCLRVSLVSVFGSVYVCTVERSNFTATSTSICPLCILPCCPRTGLSCHYCLSIHREVIVGKKPIRWAGQRIIEVMIGAVQRQLIVMETGGAGSSAVWPSSPGAQGAPDQNVEEHIAEMLLLC